MTIQGILSGIFVASEPGSLVSKRVKEARVLENGLEGDKHVGWFRKADARATRYPKGILIWNSRQISIVSEEELALIANDLGVKKIEPEWLGANLYLRSIPDISLLQPRTKLFIPNKNGGPEVGIYVTAPNKPCVGPGEVIQLHYPDVIGLASKIPKVAMNSIGVVAVVEHGGIVSSGSPVYVVVQ